MQGLKKITSCNFHIMCLFLIHLYLSINFFKQMNSFLFLYYKCEIIFISVYISFQSTKTEHKYLELEIYLTSTVNDFRTTFTTIHYLYLVT